MLEFASDIRSMSIVGTRIPSLMPYYYVMDAIQLEWPILKGIHGMVCICNCREIIVGTPHLPDKKRTELLRFKHT